MARQQLKFWLDTKNKGDRALLRAIRNLKARNKFAPAIRDGLRLVLDLRAGQTTVLLELFPWIAERLQRETPPISDDDLNRRLDQLQELIMQQGNLPASSNGYQMKSGNPKQLGVGGKVDLPRFDDDSEVLVLKKSTDSGAGMNFLAAALALQQ